jgi:hypothetical protein
MKKIKEDPRRWKYLPFHVLSEFNIVKMGILLEAVYKVNAIAIRVPLSFFKEIEKSIIKFIWMHKRPWTVKEILSKKTNAEGRRTPDFKLYYRAIEIKIQGYGKKTDMQSNEIESKIQK